MRALHEHGARVPPSDVAVVGFDDAGMSAYLTPGLTSIRQDRAGIARGAPEILFERIGGDHGPPRDLSVSYELLVRESSAPA